MEKTSLIIQPRRDLVVPSMDLALPSRRAFFRRAIAAGLGAGLFFSERFAQAVTTDNIAYGTYSAMTVTNLQSLANDSSDVFAGWQSARVDNQTSVKADDYLVRIHLPTANTAPANDQAAYVYLAPWLYDGSAWAAGGNFGTTTLPTGSEGTANISDPNSMKGPIALPYKIAQQILQGWFNVGALCGGVVPDGWSLAIRNCTGAAFSTGCVVEHRPITYTNT